MSSKVSVIFAGGGAAGGQPTDIGGSLKKEMFS